LVGRRLTVSPKKSISESTWHLAGLVEAAETLGLGFWVVFSSTMPSAKYSWSGSPLKFWNGITAIDG
jgi:hypothetical protein